MDLKQLKHETAQLPNLEALSRAFGRAWLQPIRKNTNRAHPFLQQLPEQHRKEFNLQHASLRKFLKEIRYGQVVNEKLASAAHNLVELKVAALTGDGRKAKRLLQTFLRDPQLSLKQLIVEVPYLESQLSLFHQSYHGMLEQLTAALPLEQQVALLDGKHREALQRLMRVPEQQKRHLSQIGRQFIAMMREMKGGLDGRKK